MYEREQAIGKSVILKKQIYELAVKAQSFVKQIQEETESFLSDKDFVTMDFSKVVTLANELKMMQLEYLDKETTLLRLIETFNITE